MDEKKNAVGYFRVSSKEQSKNFSLQNQKEACHRYAKQHGYRIIKGFANEQGESAKTADRPELKRLLQFVAKRANNVHAVIVYKYDRLARDMGDYTQLMSFFNKLGISILSATEPADDSSSGKFMRNILGSVAQFENDIKSERTIAGMKQALRAGRWVWKPPIGYSLVEDALGKSVLKPNEDAPYILRAFKLAEKGIYTQIEIINKLRRDGFKVNKQHLNRLLRNGLYAGLIIKPEWFDETIKALHEPIVTDKTFYRVQQILDGKRPSIKPHLRNNPEFPLSRFMRCADCIEKTTGSYSTGRHGVKYAYYKCRSTGCKFGNVRRDTLHQQFVKLLEQIKPRPEVIDLFSEIVRDVWLTKHEDIVKEQKRIETKISELGVRKKKVRRLLIDGALSKEDFDEEKSEIESNIEMLTVDLAGLEIEQADINGCVDYCRYFIMNCSELWENADVDLKQRFQSFVFPQGIEYFQGKFETPITSLVFKVLQEKTAIKSHLASPRGFEPLLPP